MIILDVTVGSKQLVDTLDSGNLVLPTPPGSSYPENQNFVSIETYEKFAREYAKNQPTIFFISDYYVDKQFIGTLICWRKYFDSTHYEVFKKNTFKEGAQFERILFLDVVNLDNESKLYSDFIKNKLGLDRLDLSKYCVILDTMVKDDRIYANKD